MRDADLAQTTAPLFTGRWEDGRPKGWPTLQLRVRGRPFDVYCDHPSDVTLDGYGIPVVAGLVASKQHLAQGWMAS
jgi:hypothetical protein